MRRRTLAEAEIAHAKEDCARALLKLYRERCEAESEHSMRTMSALAHEAAQLGVIPSYAVSNDQLRMTLRQQWIVNVTWVLADIGPIDSEILMSRCTRPKKDMTAAWDVIAAEIFNKFGKPHFYMRREIADRFDAALITFTDLIEQRGIRRELDTRPSYVAPARSSCEAAAASKPARNEITETEVDRFVTVIAPILAGRVRIQFQGLCAARSKRSRLRRRALTAREQASVDAVRNGVHAS